MTQTPATDSANKADIRNAGINGNNTADLLGRLNDDVLLKHPDLVVLMVGTNDMLSPEKGIILELYEENYQKIIGEIKPHAF